MQKLILHLTDKVENGITAFVTSGWCRKQFHVTYDTANRDLGELSILNILERKGKGRSTKYVLRVRK